MEESFMAYLKQGYSCSEIKDMLSLTLTDSVEILNKLNYKIKDNLYYKSFYSDGTFDQNNIASKEEKIAIITSPDEDTFHFVAISDTHIGSWDDNLSYLDLVYDYCKKNNINYIFHAGDLIDGTHGNIDKRKYLNDQIEEVITKYPYDELITNFITLGNHDFDSILLDKPIDAALIENRSDLIPLGYGMNEVHLKNDFFVVSHFIPLEKSITLYSRTMILKGHSHHFKIKDDRDNYNIYVPTLSNLVIPDDFVPGFLDITINFRKGYVYDVMIKSLGIINNKILSLSMNQLYLDQKIPKEDPGYNVKEYIKRR